jgi:hypothetical protein
LELRESHDPLGFRKTTRRKGNEKHWIRSWYGKAGYESERKSSNAVVEIAEDQWITFFAEFTRDHRGAHARLEVLGADVGYQVETENRPFDGVSTDVKDGEHAVWITFGSTPADHLTHGVQSVTAIRLRPPAGEAGAALEVEAKDGTRTVLELSRPEAFALPPAARKTATRSPFSRVTE